MSDLSGDEDGLDLADPLANARVRPRKAPSAFRTISEVADELHVPQHVLRFWETRFPQVKPLKRGGGRRYYRPDDITLLRSIAHLLYVQGYTIKGVQRLLREGGGSLADDIPPADGADRAAEADADGEREMLLLATDVPLSDGPMPVGTGPVGPGPGGAGHDPDTLRAWLRELEEIRALLDGR